MPRAKNPQAPGEQRSAGRPPFPAEPVGDLEAQQRYSDPAEFIRAVMLGIQKASPTQLRAAELLMKADAPKGSTKPMGKKEAARQTAAEETSGGHFAPLSPPIRRVA